MIPDSPARRGPSSKALLNVWIGCLAAGLLIGCGGPSGPPETVQVFGKVTYAGQPLEKGTITFQPVESEGQKVVRPARATLNADGTYQLSTFSEGDGALPAEYRVVIESYENEPTAEEYDAGVKRKSAIPEKYGNVLTSGQSATVPGDGTESIELNFDLPE